jgi:hypothetical protein
VSIKLPNLRLVSAAGSKSGDAVVDVDAAADQALAVRVLQAQARDSKARRAMNPDDAPVHGRRPSSDVTVGIARLLNVELDAADGGREPKRTPAERALCQRYYEQQRALRTTADNVNRLRHAVVDLAAIELSPSQLLEALSPAFDEPIIRERLERALDCLSRFMEEWQRQEAGRSSRSS